MHLKHYPVSHREIICFIHALFIKVCDLINIHGLADLHTRHASLDINLDVYTWAVSSLATGYILICCLTEPDLETIITPLTQIFVCNSCKGYSILSKTDMTCEMNTSIRNEFYIDFNTIYHDMARYSIWY